MIEGLRPKGRKGAEVIGVARGRGLGEAGGRGAGDAAGPRVWGMQRGRGAWGTEGIM